MYTRLQICLEKEPLEEWCRLRLRTENTPLKYVYWYVDYPTSWPLHPIRQNIKKHSQGNQRPRQRRQVGSGQVRPLLLPQWAFLPGFQTPRKVSLWSHQNEPILRFFNEISPIVFQTNPPIHRIPPQNRIHPHRSQTVEHSSWGTGSSAVRGIHWWHKINLSTKKRQGQGHRFRRRYQIQLVSQFSHMHTPVSTSWSHTEMLPMERTRRRMVHRVHRFLAFHWKPAFSDS